MAAGQDPVMSAGWTTEQRAMCPLWQLGTQHSSRKRENFTRTIRQGNRTTAVSPRWEQEATRTIAPTSVSPIETRPAKHPPARAPRQKADCGGSEPAYGRTQRVRRDWWCVVVRRNPAPTRAWPARGGPRGCEIIRTKGCTHTATSPGAARRCPPARRVCAPLQRPGRAAGE